MSERILRKVVFSLPTWVQRQQQKKAATYRPLIAFLPPVPNKTNLKLDYQKPSERYAREQAARIETRDISAIGIQEDKNDKK